MTSERPEDLPGVSVIVINWNGKHHLGPLLTSTSALDYPSEKLEVIVADNASSDGSLEFVEANFPLVRTLRLDRNYGFAEGNNRAASEARHEWIAFLNSDMRVESDWVRALVAPLAANPGLAAVSSKILNWDGTAIDFIGAGINFQGFGFQVDHGLRESPNDVARKLLCPCGGAMLVRKDLFLEMGGFDRDYFGFYEDTDLGWRLNLLGHDVWYTPGAVCYHRGHGSFDRVKAERTRLLYERNSMATMYKCLDDANLAAALPVTMLLLNEKALRMADFDPTPFHTGSSALPAAPRPPSGAADRAHAFDPGAPDPEGVGAKTRRVLRQQGLGTVLLKGRRYLATRLRTRLARVVKAVLGLRSGLPTVSVAHYLALSDFAHRLPELKAKREWLQSRRVRTDAELLPLFLFALEPSYHDIEYMRTHRRLVRVMGLEKRFGGAAPGSGAESGPEVVDRRSEAL